MQIITAKGKLLATIKLSIFVHDNTKIILGPESPRPRPPLFVCSCNILLMDSSSHWVLSPVWTLAFNDLSPWTQHFAILMYTTRTLDYSIHSLRDTMYVLDATNLTWTQLGHLVNVSYRTYITYSSIIHHKHIDPAMISPTGAKDWPSASGV